MKPQSKRSLTLLVGSLLALIICLGPATMLAMGQGQEAGPADPPGNDAPSAPGSDGTAPLPEGADAGWWSDVQDYIVRSEYHATWQDTTYLADVPAAYQAPNRAHDLRTYFTSDGPIVIPRNGSEGDDAPAWRWEARLVAWGRSDATSPLPEARLSAAENRIEYRRGALTEWYLNDRDGLAQGFLLASPPPVAETDGQLRLELALTGSLGAQVGEDGTGVEFREPGGELVLAFGALRAMDAGGRELPATGKLEGSNLVLLVDDSQASYPVEMLHTITGLPDSHNWYLQGNQEGAQTGFSVATAGDVNGDDFSDVIVGMPYYDGGDDEEGRVYVFYGSELGLLVSGPWVKEIDEVGARFGWSVATAGDVNGDGYSDIIIGAPKYANPLAEEGGIWVYHGSASGVESGHSAHKEGNQLNASFGTSVSTAGDVNGDGYSDVIVGAPRFDDGQEDEGHVWVWLGSSVGLVDTSLWQAQVNEPFASFGASVATAGDVNGDGYSDVIVGAPWVSVDYVQEGAVFAWYGSPDGVKGGVDGTDMNRDWFFRSGADSAQLGFSAATAGDLNGDGYSDVILGAPYAYYGEWGAGRAYYSFGGPGGLQAVGQYDYLPGENGGDNLGWSVATAGDVNGDGYADVIVGAPHHTDDKNHQGRAYLWYGSSTGVSDSADWDDTGERADAYFGNSVGTAGDVNGDGYSDIVVGSPGYLDLRGRAYAYHGGPDAPSETEYWPKRSNQEGALFGTSVGTAGDVNGDGYADLIVGAPRWHGAGWLMGSAWVYHGGPGGPDGTPDWHKTSGLDNAEYGTSVGTAGDVNGDGYADIIVGAPFWSQTYDDQGGAFIYLGSSSGVESAPIWHKAPQHADGEFGTSVGTAGDVNGDGLSDVIVGAPKYNHGSADEGMAWVYLGGDPAPSTTPHWDGEGDQANAYYGQAVGTAGDVNGDGYSDVIVGAPGWNGDEINEGRAWVYHGSPSGVQEEHSWRQRGSVFNAQYGFAVGTAGDVNGDGYSDIIVGAPNWYDGPDGEGKAWVYHGSPEGLAFSSSWRKEGGQLSARYGYSVATAGDVNGDGYADVIIGIENWSGGDLYEGGASMYYGSRNGLQDDRAWHAEVDQATAHFGSSVATAGDVNGDGYADLVVGAPSYTNMHTDEGQVFLYYGNGRPGIDMRLGQFNAQHPLVPIAPLGWSSDMHWFRVAVHTRTPYGGGWVRSEVELRPFGIPLREVNHVTGWFDSETGDGDLIFTLSGLAAGTRYHWRVRLRYDPVTVPFQQYSRWMHVPWNGWSEQDLRTAGFRSLAPVVLSNHE